VTKAPCKSICLFAFSLLTSCVIFTDHSFSGKMRIDQKSHWIKLTGGDLARTDEDKWYIYDGPGQYQGTTRVSCFEFRVGLPSYKQPPPFEVVRVEAVCNKRWPVKLSRLLKEKEFEKQQWDSSRHEIWVLSQPYPQVLAPEIPEGTYQINVHYFLGGTEFDAEWQCTYRTKTKIERWHMPTS